MVLKIQKESLRIARSIGSPKYKNLKLEKNEEKKRRRELEALKCWKQSRVLLRGRSLMTAVIGG